MRPSHPCMLCGHATPMVCERAAEGLLPRAPVQCTHCGCMCLPGSYRQGGPGEPHRLAHEVRAPSPGEPEPHLPGPERHLERSGSAS